MHIEYFRFLALCCSAGQNGNFSLLCVWKCLVLVSDALTVFFLQVPYIAAALTDSKLGAEGRKDLFEWLSKQLSGLTDFPDAVHLLKPASSAMTVILN